MQSDSYHPRNTLYTERHYFAVQPALLAETMYTVLQILGHQSAGSCGDVMVYTRGSRTTLQTGKCRRSAVAGRHIEECVAA